ncbi:hypothetical protein ACC668_37695, partial [Rhizobium ruizarguesonis]
MMIGPAGFVAESRLASARRMAFLCRSGEDLPEGVIVLPGLDLSMSEQHWQMVAPEPTPGQHTNPASRSH